MIDKGLEAFDIENVESS